MLVDLIRLREEKLKYFESLSNGFYAPRKLPSEFSDILKSHSKFSEALGIIELFDYSILLKSGKLRVVLPNQFFFILAELRNVLDSVFEYNRKYETFRDKLRSLHNESNQEAIAQFRAWKNDGPDAVVLPSEITDPLDFQDYENELAFFKRYLFGDKQFRGGREFTDATGWREDAFESVVLSFVPLPNNSSNIIGAIARCFFECQDVYTVFCRSFPSESSPRIISKEIRNFAFESFKLMLNQFGEDNIFAESEIKLNQGEIRGVIYKGLRIPAYFGGANIFGIFDAPQNKESLTTSDTQRFYSEPVRISKFSEYCYFTTQWKGSGDYDLSFERISTFIKDKSNGRFNAISNQNGYLLYENEFPIQDSKSYRGFNKIYYGAPGTGKSHRVNELQKDPNGPGELIARTVFHSEYTNADFVGQLKPVNTDTGPSYEFVPGPMMNAMSAALKNPTKKYFLVIEELNRANAASVFGEFFQLLDRSEGGASKYTIHLGQEPARWITKQIYGQEQSDFEARIPSNLSLIATMNSADQGVMHLDSAFKRRWEFEHIPIEYDVEICKTPVSISGSQTTWGRVIESINKRLSKYVAEDRLIGHRFLTESELHADNFKSAFANKVLMYLYDDVLRHVDKDVLFNEDLSNSLNDLKNAYINEEKIFQNGIF